MAACKNSTSTKKPQFGNRYLTNAENVFDHNAWDDVEWNEKLEEEAENKRKYNAEKIVPEQEQKKYETEANLFWDKFYGIHKNRFFKDRHWLFTEFPGLCVKPHVISAKTIVENLAEKNNCTEQAKDLNKCIDSDVKIYAKNSSTTILEVGCGAGNSVFPILEANIESEVFVYCCDFSEVAVSIIKDHANFDPARCHPFVLDITADHWNVPFSPSSIDIILLIFVLSAVNPEKMQNVVNTLTMYLKPGGHIFFRDYGKYDMVELRFKPGQCLADDFYVRGDGTRVYFFTEDEVHELFSNAGLIKKQNIVSRRLQVNRGKLLTMYRIWVQAVYMKPETS